MAAIRMQVTDAAPVDRFHNLQLNLVFIALPLFQRFLQHFASPVVMIRSTTFSNNLRPNWATKLIRATTMTQSFNSAVSTNSSTVA